MSPSANTYNIPIQKGITQWLKEAWELTSRLGVSEADSPYLQRKIILTNKVAVIILSFAILLTGGFLAIDSPKATINWFLVSLVVTWTVPFLNFLENRLLSRHILSTALPLFAIIFTAHIRALHPESVHPASFYVSRYFQIALSFMPAILFGFEERKHLFASFSLNVLILLFYNEIMDMLGAGLGTAEPVIKDPFFVSISSALALAVVCTGYFFLNRMNSEYEVQIEGLLEKTEQQNRNMVDAINYAKNIQQVVLPRDNVLAKLRDRLFVMYRPLHTVSGDFYMVEESKDHIIFSVIDCTGHGVPGAFMSILASSALQRSMDLVGYSQPEAIVNNANRLFHEYLSRSGNPEIQDGMDMVICSFEKKTNTLKAAGANLCVYTVNEGEVVAHRTDKGGISIGKPERNFQPISITLAAGSLVYITTDGYYDQFGGNLNKRLGKRSFRERLSEFSTLPIPEQHGKFNSFFDEWKDDGFQVDDVCLIGFRC